MFSNYFNDMTRELKAKLKKRVSAKGSQSGLKGKDKDLELYRDLYLFFQDHLPESLHVGPGKIRSKTHLLSKNIDLIFYNKWCNKFIEMTGGWHLIDYTRGVMSLEPQLSTQSLASHVNMTQAVKTLYSKTHNLKDTDFVPVVSILWAYDNKIPLLSHQKALYDLQKEKKIPLNAETDLVVIPGQALIVKDWEKNNYKVLETGKDTLMWAYILITEFLGLDRSVPFSGRQMVKKTEDYVEY